MLWLGQGLGRGRGWGRDDAVSGAGAVVVEGAGTSGASVSVLKRSVARGHAHRSACVRIKIRGSECKSAGAPCEKLGCGRWTEKTWEWYPRS